MNIQFSIRFIVLLLLLTIYFNANSQVSFLQPDTAVWRFRGFVHYDPCYFYDAQLMLSRQDTIVGIHTYRKMYQLRLEKVYFDCIEPPLGSTSPQPSIPSFAGLIREEGRRVYYWPLNYNAEYLAYDFDQQVGDTIPLYLPDIVTISLIEDIILNGKTFKQYILGSSDIQIDTFIEGIGNNSFPFLKYLDVVSSMNLVCYSRNDTIYYHRYDSCGFFEYPPVITSVNGGSDSKKTDPEIIQLMYPNPATNQVNIIFMDVGDYSVELFDQAGRNSQVESVLNKSEINLDLKSLQNGAYLLYIKNKGILVSIKKLIIIH